MATPVIVVLNAGEGANRKTQLSTSISEAFEKSGSECRIVDIFDAGMKELVLHALQQGSTIVAAGGDGTVNSIAALCYKQKGVLGVIPLGTFNYFAREHGIPPEIEEAVKVIVAGNARKVSVGFVQDHLFLNNASFGVYTKLIRQREKASSWLGRLRIVAAISAVHTLLNNRRLMSVGVHVGGNSQRYHTLMVFVGNNALQLENLGIDAAQCARMNKLSVMIMKKATRSEMLRIILRGVSRNLSSEEKLDTFCADEFLLESGRKHPELVIDGEIIRCTGKLQYRIEPEALSILVPGQDTA